MIGRNIGPYEVLAKLGEGGMGEVYRARDTRLGRDVAIKILPPEVTSEPGRLERFDREARAIAALNHPHIVTIYSTEAAEGIRFLTMELVEGHTLSDLVVSSGMSLARFFEIAIPLADALAAAHQKQITHRDLKPGNVMISNDGRVKVLDFGLARIGGGEFGEHSLAATAAPITNLGVIVGTMPYMSPEQVEGRQIDARSDLFSLGVIFYELLGGKRPFSGGSSPALMSAILRDTPAPISSTRADLPDGLERLIDRLIEKRPEDRVQTARDVFNELKHLRKQLESGGSRASSAGSGAAVPPHNLWIAVLPFSVRGNDHDAVELAAGLTDDIAASLTRFQVFNVVASQSTRAYKDSSLDVRQIADRLGARYVIGGNVRTSSRLVRTTAQLIDASSGAQLWSETYDRDATAMDLFAIQDDVADHIVATIADQSGVLARSMTKAVRTHLPASEQTARELILRAWALRLSTESAEHARVREAIEARLATEPDNSDLWAELAHLYLDEQILVMDPQPDSLVRAGRAARRSVEIDPNNQRGWTELAAACFFTRDRAGLFDGGERAIAINPRNAYSLGWIGNLFTHAGEYERGNRLAERGMQINPRHPGWCHIGTFNKHFAAGDYEAALRSARRVNMPDLNWSFFVVATAAAHLNLMDEARQAADRMIAITPALADPALRRKLTEMWFWERAMVDALLDGVQRALSAGPVTQSRSGIASPSSSGSRPPSSAPGSTAGGGLTVAVRPFMSRSPDEESRSLADGLTDDITSGLSKFGYLRVLSRSVAERLATDQSALRARARYELEGQLRKSGSQVRIGVTLVDTQTGTNLWTQSTDHAIDAGMFAIQDTVSSAVVATIGDQTGVLMRAMAAAAADRPLDQLSVPELVVRHHLYAESFDPREHARLREAFERALEREPRAAEGWACLALLYEHEHSFGFNALPDSIGRERRAAQRANELDPNSQQAWIAMASVHCFARDREALKSAVERAATINPLNAELLALGGVFLSVAGETDRACALVKQAMRLKPQHAGWYYFPLFNAAYRRGDFEEALRLNRRAGLQRMMLHHVNAVAVSGQLGLKAEATAALHALRETNPAFGELKFARDVWTRWIWDNEDDVIASLEQGFTKGLALANGPSAASMTSKAAADHSIAVLPFTDLSENKDQDWFCDGIAEEIMSVLASLPGLRVAARASAFSLRGKTDDLSAIGEKLNVATVLEGSVRRSGDRVRITTQLSDARQGRQLWSERFDRELKDIFEVQDHIARAVADRLRVTVAGGGDRLVQQPTSNIEAYELLLKARVFLNRRGPAIAHATECFEKAIALDPNLADAHAGLGDTYRLFGIYGLMPTRDASARARQSLERALAIDPDQVEALATLANIRHAFEWDFAAARALTERALARDPSHVRALAESAVTLATAKAERSSPALDQLILERIGRARSLDPLNAWTMAIEAMVLAMLGRQDAAIAAAAHAVAADPDNFTAHWSRVFTLALTDRTADAEAAAEPGLAMSARHPILLAELATLHGRDGDAAAAERIHDELLDRATTSFVSPGACAIAAAAAGRMDEARRFVAQSIADRDAFICFYKLPAWRPVLADPECARLLQNSPLIQHAPV